MCIYIEKLLVGFHFDGNSINNGRMEKKSKSYTISNVNTRQSKNYMESKDSNFHLISTVNRLIIEMAAWVRLPTREYRRR